MGEGISAGSMDDDGATVTTSFARGIRRRLAGRRFVRSIRNRKKKNFGVRDGKGPLGGTVACPKSKFAKEMAKNKKR